MLGELPFFALPVQDCAAQLGERQDFLHCPYIRLIFPLTAQVKRAFCVVKAAVFAVSQLVRQLVGLIGGGLDLSGVNRDGVRAADRHGQRFEATQGEIVDIDAACFSVLA